MKPTTKPTTKGSFAGYADGHPDNHPFRRDVRVRLHSFSHCAPMGIDAMISVLKQWKSERGFDRLEVEMDYDHGDENNLGRPYASLILYGKRKETKEEMVRRLQSWANRFLMDRLTHHRMVKAYKGHLSRDLATAMKHAHPVVLKNHKADLAKAERGDLT